MATNKERIENLEAAIGQLKNTVGQLQGSISQMDYGINSKLQLIEVAISKFSEMSFSNKDGSSSIRDRSQNRYGREDSREGGKPIFASKLAKIEFPKFSGDDPIEWMTRVEQFFDYQKTYTFEKVCYHLQGEVNQWWRWLKRSYEEEGKEVSWDTFVEELSFRFGPTECEDFDESLSKIRQTGPLRDYQREFERLGNKVKGWTLKALVGTFMGGLKTEISDRIRMFTPKTLKEAINYARMRDEQPQRQKKAIRTFTPPSSLSPTKEKTATPVKRLSWEEMQKRRAAGLCFNCDAKFTPGHRCAKPQLLLLDGGTEDEGEDEPEISLHALIGWSNSQTMRVLIKIGSTEMIVLIDSSSTHNFINGKMAESLRLPATAVKPKKVKVANGGHLHCSGKFEDVNLLVQGIPFTIILYSLPIMGLDMVLGIQWLQQLGDVNCNWKNLTMKFHWNGHLQFLKGINSQLIQPYSTKKMEKELRHRGSIFAICFQMQQEVLPNRIHPDMQQLLHQYSDIYQHPTELPSDREINHRILLKEGTDPVNVRLYSTSPFSSPILLVKKKDRSWRFCTDYRALNAITVRDRFSISTVDDMIDELHGAAYFTKLDLRAGFHQVRVHPDNIHKTAFRIHNGHYEYLVMPFGSNWTMHLEHVKLAFEILRQHQFFIKLSKCAFGQQQIEYLGHIVSHEGVMVDQGKIRTMIDWPKPTNVSNLRGFLGLTEQAKQSFTDLKQAMSSTPTLAMLNFNEEFVITTYASNEGIGAVLSQQDKPIAFISKSLGVSKQTWSTYAKEMFAIVHIVTPEQQKWVSKLLGYDYEIRYKPDKENVAADALSRIAGSPSLDALFSPLTSFWDSLRATVTKHPYMIQIGKLATSNPGKPYLWRAGLILYKNRVVIPPV
ncbi:uncharacterized protein LOC110625649 [Manihot esculenta]|uniref:uncharacterized protein LOC110625649 n=1 Tax=Manihot esculenta TaxID=3983 RepID=UPI001CC75F8D|nr:uncharacterized protein LOC110625649 [Manihot esculenta]